MECALEREDAGLKAFELVVVVVTDAIVGVIAVHGIVEVLETVMACSKDGCQKTL